MKSQAVSALTLAAVYGTAQGLNAATTPSEKVVQLLNKLTVEVKEEGKTEEKQFADYAKFCRRTIDEKKYVIDKQTKKIASLTANIDALTADIKELTGDLDENAKAIAKSEADIKKLDEDRDKAVETYNGQAKEMSQSISALSRAIKVIAAADSELEGKVDRTALLQAGEYAAQVLQSASSIRNLKISAEEIETLTNLQAKPGEAATFTSKTTGVVSMLKGLLSTFKANKATLDMDEETAKGTYQKTRLALNQQLDIQNREKSEKTMTKTEKTEDKGKADTDKTATTQAKTADSAFLGALEKDCDAKAKLNDDRSAKRKEELEALAEAAKKLKEGGVMKEPESFLQISSNGEKKQEKKQEQKSTHRAHHWTVVRDLSPEEAQKAAMSALKEQEAESFLQLEARTSVMNRLSSEAARLHSRAMMGVALRARGNDNFVAVRAVVRNLMEKLEKQGEEEATTKATCDEMVTKHSKERDDANAMIETKTTEIAALTSSVNTLTEEVADLNDQIAKTTKDLEEATALRSKEKANNEKALEEAKTALDGTSMALDILKKFYEGESLIQKKADQPKDAYSGEFVDSSGKGLSDVAPKVELGTQESSGVLGMLDVLKSDFESQIASTTKEEKEAADEYAQLKEDSEKELDNNNEAVTTKTGTIKTKTEDNMKAKGVLQDNTDKLNLAKDALDKLRDMCTNDENAYEKRKAKREEEIKSLESTLESVNAMIKEEEDAGGEVTF